MQDLNTYTQLVDPKKSTRRQFVTGVSPRGICAALIPSVLSGRAHFESVKIITDANARTNALRAGHLFKRMAGIEVLQVDDGWHQTLPLHNEDIKFVLSPPNNNGKWPCRNTH